MFIAKKKPADQVRCRRLAAPALSLSPQLGLAASSLSLSPQLGLSAACAAARAAMTGAPFSSAGVRSSWHYLYRVAMTAYHN
eukprot:scaffold34493_cov73-Isochrysis_galbana.AAC.1